MDDAPTAVTLDTLHRDLFELKSVLVTGLQAFPPEWPREVVRLLREGNRLNEERAAKLDVTIREQALETHTILRALADGQRQLVDGQRNLFAEMRSLSEEMRALAEEMRALVARIDALIRARGNGPSRS